MSDSARGGPSAFVTPRARQEDAVDQLALIEAPVSACTRPLEDLVREVAATKRVPLWAVVAGECWFARAWAECQRERWIGRLVYLAFDREIYTDERIMETMCWACTPREGDEFPACVSCATTAREVAGTVTLAMVAAGLEARRG